jgi:phosphohistidine swiveling domain-containing protein
MDPTENLKEVHRRFPEAKIILVHGDDWRALPASDYVRQIGGSIIQPEYYSRLSRQNIVKKFAQSLHDHPLKHEFYTQHFRLGNIVQFNSQPVNRLISSKANTLKSFRSLLKASRIEKLFVFTTDEFLREPERVIKAVQRNFDGKNVVVRSSSFNEDKYSASNAGQYESVIGVLSSSPIEVRQASEKVIKSYREKGIWNPRDQILVQTQTEDVVKSGVVFTRNMETGAPYYLVNYDDTTGRSDAVTGGEASKSIWFLREAGLNGYPRKWRKLMGAILEIEKYLQGMVLDIEFAERKNGEIVIFQIRPLAASLARDDVSDEMVRELIDQNVSRYGLTRQEISGKTAFLSDMAFWNPAELIGDSPRPLDYSIFREIITKRAWNEGLTPLGYSDVSNELMVRFGNKPYIVVDHAFRSLIPASLEKKLKRKLYEFYLAKLRKDLTAHDKIEFEVVASCYGYDLAQRLEEMRKWGMSETDVAKVTRALRRLTNDIIKHAKRRLREDLADLRKLARIRETFRRKASQTKDAFILVDFFQKLLDSINDYGTPQFSRVARQAFIAGSLLKGLVLAGKVSEDQVNGFLQELTTVASEFESDFEAWANGRMGKRRFLEKYGHLRAGTYDIRAQRYDEMKMFNLSRPKRSFKEAVSTVHETIDRDMLEKISREFGFPAVSAGDFLSFMKSSLEQREYFKFEFTKSLSLALAILTKAGQELGFSRDDLSYLDLSVIRSTVFCSDAEELKHLWRHYVDSRKQEYVRNEKLVLPPVVEKERDFKVVSLFTARPNFVTHEIVDGELVNLEENQTRKIDSKIVLLEKADPGFDWIFTKNIKGLITKYGGAASHMAIRCAEFRVPAAIGCGDNIYNKIRNCRRVRLDCRGKKILNL